MHFLRYTVYAFLHKDIQSLFTWLGADEAGSRYGAVFFSLSPTETWLSGTTFLKKSMQNVDSNLQSFKWYIVAYCIFWHVMTKFIFKAVYWKDWVGRPFLTWEQFSSAMTLTVVFTTDVLVFLSKPWWVEDVNLQTDKRWNFQVTVTILWFSDFTNEWTVTTQVKFVFTGCQCHYCIAHLYLLCMST